jgi:hypothetical protein
MNRSQRFGLCLAFVCLCVVVLPVRQSLAGLKDEEWKPIDPADLALKDNPASPGAHAMILYRESIVNEKYAAEDGAYVQEYVRTKIFTQQGTDSANVEVPFIKEISDVKDVRARTIRPDGTIVNFDGKPFEKMIEKFSGIKVLAKTWTLPDAKPGCIIEYKYRLQYKPLHLPDHEWVLSSDLFTREGHFTILPFDSYWQNFPLRFRQYGLKDTVTPQKEPQGYWGVTVKDIPAVWEEPNMPPDKALEARIELFHDEEGTPPNETTDQFWARTEKKWNGETDHFIGKKNVAEAEVAKTVAASDTPEQKLRKLYDRTQQLRNLSFEDSKSDKEKKQENLKDNNNVEDVLKRGYGSERDVNVTFVALARAAGFEANSVLVAPRNSNVFFPQMRDTGPLTADIVWVKAGDKEYWLDPAARYFPFGILPWYETNTNGVRISSKPSDFVISPEPKIDDAVITRSADISIDPDGAATGKISVDFAGQFAALRREEGHKDDETAHKKTTEDDIKKWLPADSSFELTKLENWDKTDQPLHVEGTVKIANLGSAAGHRMLLPSSIFVPSQTKTFETAIRHNAVYFHFPYKEADTLKYTAPPSFKVDAVPDKKGTNPGSIVVYEMTATHDGASAQVQRTLKINALVVETKYYGALRSFFNTVKSNDQSQIVLQTSETAKN